LEPAETSPWSVGHHDDRDWAKAIWKAGDREFRVKRIRAQMIFQRTNCDVEDLLNSEGTAVICQAEGDQLKRLVVTVYQRGWRAAVLETNSGQHWFIFTASSRQESIVVDDIRMWSLQYGYSFFLKRFDEELSTPRANAFVLPNGHEVEIRNVLTLVSQSVYLSLSKQKVLPKGYVIL
jgi:hypothetical protein